MKFDKGESKNKLNCLMKLCGYLIGIAWVVSIIGGYKPIS